MYTVRTETDTKYHLRVNGHYSWDLLKIFYQKKREIDETRWAKHLLLNCVIGTQDLIILFHFSVWNIPQYISVKIHLLGSFSFPDSARKLVISLITSLNSLFTSLPLQYIITPNYLGIHYYYLKFSTHHVQGTLLFWIQGGEQETCPLQFMARRQQPTWGARQKPSKPATKSGKGLETR